MNDRPILNHKYYNEPSIFHPENLIREARRQKNLSECNVPKVCVLDPDGDLVRYLKGTGEATKNECWACYHSEMYTYELDGTEIGIIPCAVGASYAVLVAEQLFVSECELLISVTSAGMVKDHTASEKFALITEAVRDEGTSYHYLPPERASKIQDSMLDSLRPDGGTQTKWIEATSWTTDAPYRETQTAIDAYRKKGVTCVEMEAAALYAYAEYTGNEVICFAHLTNTMAQEEGDFEKGEEFGSLDTLALIAKIIKRIPVST